MKKLLLKITTFISVFFYTSIAFSHEGGSLHPHFFEKMSHFISSPYHLMAFVSIMLIGLICLISGIVLKRSAQKWIGVILTGSTAVFLLNS